MDRHFLRQKVRQKTSVIKTNTFDDIKKIVHSEDNINTSVGYDY
jgi:hypothetical protein